MTDLDILFNAICKKESNFDAYAQGDFDEDGIPQAIGIVQIHPCTIKEANRILGMSEYTLEDRWSVGRSAEIFRVCAHHWLKPRYKADLETVARRWVGGYKNAHTKAADRYWADVQKYMKEMRGHLDNGH